MPRVIDTRGTIGRLATTTFTRRRFDAGASAFGIYDKGAPTDTAGLTGVLNRPGPRVMRMVPEAERANAKWMLHTVAELRTARDPEGGNPGVVADQVLLGAVVYEVVSCEAHTAHGLFYAAVLATKES